MSLVRSHFMSDASYRAALADARRPLFAKNAANGGTALFSHPRRWADDFVQLEFRRLSEGEAVSDFYGKPAGVVTWADGAAEREQVAA